ncbi:hypothetical protein AUP68_11000 [Ilyonectria robusta]
MVPYCGPTISTIASTSLEANSTISPLGHSPCIHTILLTTTGCNHRAPGSPDIGSLSYGAGLSISSRGEGYYYGGWINNATDASWGSGPGILTSYLLQYDMDSNSWTNTTTPDKVGRVEGVMVYIPAGNNGMLIYFGGIRDAGNGMWEGQLMEDIIIYDILSGKLYVQNATGNVPEPRRQFCAGVTWPDDQSSCNI